MWWYIWGSFVILRESVVQIRRYGVRILISVILNRILTRIKAVKVIRV